MENKSTIRPVISEKSYALANAENKYTFAVDSSTSKTEVAKAVENEFKVKVVSVNSIIKPGKRKRDLRNGKFYRKADVKKVIVKLKAGDKINDFFNLQ